MVIAGICERVTGENISVVGIEQQNVIAGVKQNKIPVAMINNYWRTIGIKSAFKISSPDKASVSFIQGNHIMSGAPGGEIYFIFIDQGGFGITPFNFRTVIFFEEVGSPDFIAI